MSRRSRNATPKPGPSKLRPPEPTLTPPPGPPPPPRPVSFAEGADFISFEDGAGESDVASGDDMPVLSISAKGKQKALEPNGKKRKSDAMDDPFDNSRHVRSRVHQPPASRSHPWMQRVRWEGCMNSAEMLHREVEAFYEYLSPTDEEHSVREMIIRTVERAIVTAFPDAKLKPFGSFETRLYLPLGDIDLVLCSREAAFHDKRRVLQLLASVMKRADITNHVTIIAKARVPIIKFVTRIGKFAIDISINQETGVLAGDVVNHFLEAFPAARRLIMLVKAFLKQREINEVFSGGLGSYSTVILVISFLQMHPKVRRGEIDPEQNLGVLVNEFLEFYGKYFNYSEVGVSVLEGGTYFSKRRRGWGGKAGLQLSIEDPCDTSNDVSAGSFAMHRVKNAFSGANDALSLALLKKAQNLIDLGRQYYDRERSDSRYRTYVEPDVSSMLGCIIGVTDEVIHQRRLAQSVWDSGTLHQLVGEKHPPQKPSSRLQSTSRSKRSKSPSRPSSKRIDKKRPPAKPLSKNGIKGDKSPKPHSTKGGFSMDQELDMELSDGEIIYVGSDTEGEPESRYSVKPPNQKQRQEAIYVSDQDSSHGYNSQEDLPVTRVAPVTKSKIIKIDRKREYWSSKASLAVGSP